MDVEQSHTSENIGVSLLTTSVTAPGKTVPKDPGCHETRSYIGAITWIFVGGDEE